MALRPQENIDKKKRGVGANDELTDPVRFMSILKRSYSKVNKTGRTRFVWHRSRGAPLQKGPKVGSRGKRVVHVLRIQGQAFYARKMAARRPRPFSHADQGVREADGLQGH